MCSFTLVGHFLRTKPSENYMKSRDASDNSYTRDLSTGAGTQIEFSSCHCFGQLNDSDCRVLVDFLWFTILPCYYSYEGTWKKSIKCCCCLFFVFFTTVQASRIARSVYQVKVMLL